MQYNAPTLPAGVTPEKYLAWMHSREAAVFFDHVGKLLAPKYERMRAEEKERLGRLKRKV